VRPPPPVGRAPAGGNGARPGGGSAPARAANAAVSAAPAQATAAPGLHDLFDDGSAPPAAEPEPGEPPPMWPQVPPTEECLLVGIALVRDKKAPAAISRGEVESLQLITAASAALSRDLHGFKEVADRLRGVGSAPRLGGGSLDPEIVLPGQMYRPPPKSAEPAPVRAELREF